MIETSAYLLAERFIGTKEIPGKEDNPMILAMLKMDDEWPEHDEVPWCSSFINYIAWQLRLPRSKSKLARSWLNVGVPIHSQEARAQEDIVILKRGTGDQPGPENTTAPGHVGFFVSLHGSKVYILGGNQGDSVSVKGFSVGHVLGYRRLKK